MIDGINLIEKYEIVEMSILNILVMLFVVIIIYVSFAAVSFKRRKIRYAAIGAFLSVIFGVSSMCFMMDNNIFVTETGVYEYKITIEDSVGFNEFHEKYEIINHYDDVYVVREK